MLSAQHLVQEMQVRINHEKQRAATAEAAQKALRADMAKLKEQHDKELLDKDAEVGGMHQYHPAGSQSWLVF